MKKALDLAFLSMASTEPMLYSVYLRSCTLLNKDTYIINKQISDGWNAYSLVLLHSQLLVYWY